MTGKIALAHLKEFPDYYDRLGAHGAAGRASNSAALHNTPHAWTGVDGSQRHHHSRVAHPAGGRAVAGSNPVAPTG